MAVIIAVVIHYPRPAAGDGSCSCRWMRLSSEIRSSASLYQKRNEADPRRRLHPKRSPGMISPQPVSEKKMPRRRRCVHIWQIGDLLIAEVQYTPSYSSFLKVSASRLSLYRSRLASTIRSATSRFKNRLWSTSSAEGASSSRSSFCCCCCQALYRPRFSCCARRH